jgi:hypothetical protein
MEEARSVYGRMVNRHILVFHFYIHRVLTTFPKIRSYQENLKQNKSSAVCHTTVQSQCKEELNLHDLSKETLIPKIKESACELCYTKTPSAVCVINV